jgi:hypothetical protein
VARGIEMRRTFTQVKLDEAGSTRNVVVLYDEPSEQGSQLYHDRQILFLQYISNDIRLVSPGDSVFETLNISHNGNSWCATAVSVTTKTNTEK